METNTKPILTKGRLIVFLILFLVFILLFFLIKDQSSNKNDQEGLDQPSNSRQEKGVLTSVFPTQVASHSYFKLLPPSYPVQAGSTFELLVEADSDTKIISGFDVLLEFDKSAFDFVKIASLNKDYRVFSYQAPITHLSITGTRDLASKNEMPLNKTNLLTIAFKAKKTGNYRFVLKPAIGNEVSQMIDNHTNKIIPQVNEISVTIK
jgi:hypothetical protein